MTIAEKEAEIVSEFEFLTDWLDKYELIIDKGNQNPGIDPQYKTDQYLIEGCQSKVWVQAEYRDGKVYYQGESNTEIVGGMVSMLIDVLSGETPDDILAAELGFIDQIGLKEHLSPTRSNGLVAMVKQMRLYAMVFKEKSDEP
ncbi:MAG: SufE family protein [Paludibacteraceae bacterium]|nr:SufE family protein [Paludibacteraceae bacterium]